MGLMDKVKAQADKLAQQAQETAKEGRARLDQAQADKHADVLMRNLGALVYAERTNRATPETGGQITKLVGEISAHEAENGINLAPKTPGWRPPAGGSGGSSAPSGGSSAPSGGPSAPSGGSGAPSGTPSTPFNGPQ